MRKPATGFRGKRFSAKSSPHEDVQGEKGQATREVTKIKLHLICRTDSEALSALIHSDGISYRENLHTTVLMQSLNSKAHVWEMPPSQNELVSTGQPAG